MNDANENTVARKPRADAARNRIRLIDEAKAAFTEHGADVSLEEIARRAGVGIGTLYRHFPTRDALLRDVYRHSSEEIIAAAGDLAATLPPVEALRAWLRLFVDYIATKQVILPAVNAMVGGSAALQPASGPTIMTAMTALVDAAVAAGDLRGGLDPSDLLRAVMGVARVDTGPDWQARACRLIDILITGMAARG